jgi:hemoglobin
MKRFIIISFLISLLLGCASTQPRQDDTLYQQLGGDIGIDELVVTSLQMLRQEQRVAPLFEDIDDNNLIEQLSDQLCFLSGGPCQYEGLAMQDAHAGMALTEAEFDIFVQVFMNAMRANNIPFSAQNQLLAMLAPMRPDIIHQ